MALLTPDRKGPFDLSKHMGVERGGQEHEAAIERILKATKSAGKKAAIFCERISMLDVGVRLTDLLLQASAEPMQRIVSTKVSTWSRSLRMSALWQRRWL